MVGRIKTGATAGTQTAGGGILNFAGCPAGDESVAGGALLSDMTQQSFFDEDDAISFEEEFWTAGRSQEKAISLLYMRSSARSTNTWPTSPSCPSLRAPCCWSPSIPALSS